MGWSSMRKIRVLPLALLISLSMLMACSCVGTKGRRRKSAGHDGAAARGGTDSQDGTDPARAIVHDAQAHAPQMFQQRRDAAAVVPHGQGRLATAGTKLDGDARGASMLDGVADGFLDESVEVLGDGVVPNLKRTVQIGRASCRERV